MLNVNITLRLLIKFIVKYYKKENSYITINKQDGTMMLEKHSYIYYISVFLMKLGIFGNPPTTVSIYFYNLLSNHIHKQSNKIFKDDNECKKTITKFMKQKNFTKQDINDIIKQELIIKNYPTFNSFFIREINMNNRPIININKKNIYSPADCRARFLSSDKSFEIKGRKIKLEEIGFKYTNYKNIILCRLIPLDYHRFHSPVSGKIVNIRDFNSTFNVSVNELVIPEYNPFGINARKIVEIQIDYKDKNKHTIEMAIIGATFVDDIVFHKKIGDKLKAGEELGWFNYGSCIIINLNNYKLNKPFVINDTNEMYLQVRNFLGSL